MADAHKNFAYSTVATAPSPATSGTSLVVASGDGALFPAVPFNATVWPTGAQPTAANAEIVRVTARATDTLTITRTQESTSARTVVVGDQIAATITAKTLVDAETLTTSSNYVSADVTMTTAGTFYDGGTLTLAAGTWLLIGAVQILAATTATREWTAKLWDGTTTFSNAAHRTEGTAQTAKLPMHLSAVVAPGSSTTYKISVTSTVNADILLGTGVFCTYLHAVKLT